MGNKKKQRGKRARACETLIERTSLLLSVAEYSNTMNFFLVLNQILLHIAKALFQTIQRTRLFFFKANRHFFPVTRKAPRCCCRTQFVNEPNHSLLNSELALRKLNFPYVGLMHLDTPGN